MVSGMSLQISFGAGQPTDVAADVVVLGVWVFGGKKAPPALQAVDTALGGALMALLAKDEFSGKRDQMLSVATMGKMKATRLIVLGLGDRAAARDPEVRAFAARAVRAAMGERAKSLAIIVPDGAESRLRAVAEGVELGAYRFTKYFTGDRKPKAELTALTIFTSKKVGVTAKKDVVLGQRVAAAVNISRDLSNEPSNKLTPAQLALEAQKMAKANGLKIQVFDHKEILKRGMSLIDAVGRGSENEPRFVHMQYTPKGKSKRRLVFVGKGVTFDTGGISIKPAAGMGEMKHDMSGAGNMVGLMAAVAALEPNVEVHAIMACAENMPDGKAYRPGDVWPSLDGKTVEIINTDAEGRLVLADALAYARALEPDVLVDNATLTGACVVALGNTCSAFYATNESTANEFQAALKASGEQMWRMPLLEELKDQLKSDVADIKHTGDRFGGSISAALFLREFIGTVKNWVHADIAGPATADRASGWNPKGATGHGVLTFLALVERANGRGGKK
jgi:leucyl aminopeptidase